MKVVIFTLSILFANIVISQTHQITKHNGEELDVNFIKHENDLLHYSLPGSFEEQKISKHAVSYLTDKQNNQSEKVTDKIIVDSKSDYNLVKVLQKHQTLGLKEATTFSGDSSKTKGESKIALQKHTANRIRIQSASNGYPFVSIVENDNGKYEAVAYVY